MGNLKQEINKIREQLIDYSLLTLMILAIPAVVFSTINTIRFGWNPGFTIYFIEFLIVAILFLSRKKISIILKAHIIASLFIIAGLLGNLFFSLSGGHFLCLVGITLITLFYGKIYGVIYSLISLSGYILIEVLNSNGIIERNVDFNSFNNNFTTWISAIFTLIFLALIIIFSISYFYNYFMGLITDLNNKNSEIIDLNNKNEKALKKIEDSEIKYKSIFQTLEEGIVITDDKGKIIDCNSASENLLGVNKEVLLNINILEQDWGFIRPDLSIMPFEECPGKIAFHKNINVSKVELGLKGKDGVKWFIVSSAPLKLEGYGVFNTFTDITKRKEEEERNAIFNRNFEAFLEYITDFVYFKDINSRMIFCSQSTANLTKHKKWQDMIGKNDLEIFPPSTAKIYLEEDRFVLENGKQLLGKIDLFYDENGEQGYIQTNKWPLFDENHNVVGIFGMSRNITEQLIEQELLKEREEKISLLLNSTAEGIYGIDLNGNCTFVNKSCVSILGFDSEEEFLGKNMHDLIHHSYENKTYMDVKVCKILQAFHKGEGVHVDDEVFWKKDGTCFPVEYYSYPQIKNEEIIGAVITFNNITERKAIEEQLFKYAKDLKILNSDKDKFIRILAHDLKNPFNSLIGFSELLLNNIDNFDINTIKEYISIINDTSNKTYNLLEEILLWLNAQYGKLVFEPSEINLKELVSNIILDLKLTAESKNILLTSNIQNNIYALADINMLRTVFRNLISNAIKFTNYNGNISVDSEINNNEIIITVSDNGIGISEDKIKTIFDSLHFISEIGTAGEKGTGLGLSICKEFIEKHGCRIWVESKEGIGSNFKFTIPISEIR